MKKKTTTKKIKFIATLCLTVFLSLYCINKQIVEGNTMKDLKKYNIRIITGGNVIKAVLEDNPTARDFISLLPLDLKLED